MQCLGAVVLGTWGCLGVQGSFKPIRTTEMLGKQTIDNLEPGPDFVHFNTRQVPPEGPKPARAPPLAPSALCLTVVCRAHRTPAAAMTEGIAAREPRVRAPPSACKLSRAQSSLALGRQGE